MYHSSTQYRNEGIFLLVCAVFVITFFLTHVLLSHFLKNKIHGHSLCCSSKLRHMLTHQRFKGIPIIICMCHRLLRNTSVHFFLVPSTILRPLFSNKYMHIAIALQTKRTIFWINRGVRFFLLLFVFANNTFFKRTHFCVTFFHHEI